MSVVLLLTIAGGLGNYWGDRPLLPALGVAQPKRLPSYSTFRRVMWQLGYEAFSQMFNAWAKDYVEIDPGEWVAVDGKSIRGSVSAYNQSAQNVTMLVSVFSHKRGFVLHSQPMENKQIGEQQVVQSIVETLNLNGAVVTADALHTKKTIAAIVAQGAHYLFRAGDWFCHNQYAISDLKLSAYALGELVRGHWSIENQLCWPKTVVLGEDKAPQRTGQAPANWSTVRNFFFNVVRKQGDRSIAKAVRAVANRPRAALEALDLIEPDEQCPNFSPVI